jgi:hypothetical protein
MAITKGTLTGGADITTDTPVYEWDTTTTPNTTYIRYESGTAIQYIEKVTGTTFSKTYALWANRATATYTPINQ